LLAAGVEPGVSFTFQPTARPTRKDGVTTWTQGILHSIDLTPMAAFEGTTVILNSAGWPGTSHTTTVTIRARVRAARMHSERGA